MTTETENISSIFSLDEIYKQFALASALKDDQCKLLFDSSVKKLYHGDTRPNDIVLQANIIVSLMMAYVMGEDSDVVIKPVPEKDGMYEEEVFTTVRFDLFTVEPEGYTFDSIVEDLEKFFEENPQHKSFYGVRAADHDGNLKIIIDVFLIR